MAFQQAINLRLEENAVVDRTGGSMGEGKHVGRPRQ